MTLWSSGWVGTDLGGAFKEQGLAKRDLYSAAIWVGVLLLHVACVWGATALWTRERVAPPDIQWVQAVPLDGSASVAKAAPPRPLSPPATAPVPAQRPAMRPDPRPEPLPVRPATEAANPHEGRSEARAAESRAIESTPMVPVSPPPAAARQASADLTPPSQSASYLNNPPPPYPAMSKRLGEQGRVVVRVYIDEQGVPKEALLDVKSGYSRLDTAALEAVMSWRYVPAKRAGVPVAMWFNVPVTFDLKSSKE